MLRAHHKLKSIIGGFFAACISWVLLSLSPPDTAYINELNDKSFAIRKANPDSATLLANEAIRLSEAINFNKGLGDGYLRLGLIAKDHGNFSAAFSYYHRSLYYRKKLGNEDLVARVFNNLGVAFTQTSQYDSAIHYCLSACRIAEKLDNQEDIGKYTMNLGIAYMKNEDYKEAEKCFSRAQQVHASLGDSIQLMRVIINLSSLYNYTRNYPALIRAAGRSLELAIQLGDEENKNIALGNLGLGYLETGQADTAIILFRQSLAGKLERGENRRAAIDLSNLGIAYSRVGQPDSAVRYLEQSLVLSEEMKENELSGTNCQNLAGIYHSLGHYKTAYQYRVKFEMYKDSVFSQSKAEAITEMQTRYETEKKEQQIQLQNTQLSRQRILRNALIAVAALIVLVGLLYVSRLRLKQKQKTLAEHKRISSDLHDDIGATLSSFSITSETVKYDLKEGKVQEALEAVENIGSESRELMDRLSDIVWAINPRNDSFEKLTYRLKAYAQKMCAGKAIQLQFTVEESQSKDELPMEVRNNFFLILKEAINNAVKYSGCTELMVTLGQSAKGLRGIVGDNGKGFNPQNTSDGNGLRNMKNRAEEINASFELASWPGQGTKLSVAT
jgi:signal transduction histidine kinase